MSVGKKGSAIFSGFRALGLYSNHLAHVLRFHKKHREFYVLTAVGQCFHTYNVSKVSTSDVIIYVFASFIQVVHTYTGHQGDVHLLLPFGDHLISVDKDNVVIIWDVESEDTYLQISYDKASFEVSALMHPSTYLNKILFGSSQGSLQLWNIKSNKLLFTFPGWASAVTVLQQTPAVDVVGVGLASGQIIIHNIRCNETLMKFQQDWGPVTALSFRTDGHPIMASGSPIGHIGLWDLEEKKLVSQMRDAHTTAIAGLTFLQNEPLLITNGADNAIRVWIFDVAGGDGRLLRHRTGHSAPPTKIKHNDQSGLNILSAGQDGTLQSFSTVHERFNKSLGHGTLNKTRAKKKGVTHDTAKLPAITTFASETARQSDWDGIIACHRGFLVTTTWNYQKGSIGAHKLEPERFNKNLWSYVVQAVDITSCGNFAVIALSSGHIDVYNMQSGFHRGHYGKDKAHAGPVRGVSVDALNQLTVSVGADRLLKIWRFKSKELLHTHSLPAAPASSLLHRDSGMLAIALDDFTIQILDMETRRAVRRFSGHRGQINDMTFSPDGRWLITASMDCAIRTWDLPSGSLVDCFLVDAAAVSLSMSPTGNFLASSHVDGLGIYLWSNNTLCSMVSLRPLSADYEPTVIMLPGTCPNTEEEEVLDADSSEMLEYISPAQLDEHLVTLSLLPDSRWKNLLHLDIIKKKNKPKEPPKLPKAAPFFIPTIPGLVPQFALPTTPSEDQVNALDSDPAEYLLLGIYYCVCVLKRWRSFEFLTLNNVMLLFQLHLRFIADQPELMEEAESVSAHLEETWMSMQTLLNQNICLLSYIKSALL
uniref:WD repeat domain 36 n=1 Tax=Cyprinus carpio TaxID=7962 RepID=A0A8C2FXE6_CYPCA